MWRHLYPHSCRRPWPGPEMQTRDQRSALYHAHIDSGDRLSGDFLEKSSKFATRILARTMCFENVDWRPGSQASEARHGSGMLPTAGFPCSSAGSDHVGHDRLRRPCPISGFPTPEHFEASAMPPQNGLRSHHLDRTNKAWPEPGHPYEQRAISAAKSKTRWCPPQCDGELMTEKQILSFKPAPRLEQVGYKHSERVHDRKHRFQ